MTDTTTTSITEWYADSQKDAGAFLRVMRRKLAELTCDRAEALWVAHRLIPEDLSPDEITAMWLVTVAELLDAQDELAQAPASHQLESAALRRYADRYHSFAASLPGTSGPGEPQDPDAWCLCGSSWSDDGGCVERKLLLEEAAVIARDNGDAAVVGT